jgi:membrane protein DedA with SNARE-associated domain/membrane-associated phospholipid phosphatase
MMQHLTAFMNDYGYLVLVFSLTLGILAIPVPIEALMGYAGFLAFQGQLNWFGSILAATIGCMLGMFISYLIGSKLGMPFFEKYGSRVHLGPERLNKTSLWFEKYGNKLIIIAFFIPGVRHFTGYFSGITRLPFRIFTIYSSLGSIIWVSAFILLGKLLGPKWQVFHEAIKKYLIIGSIFIAIFLIIFYLIKKYRNELLQISTSVFKRTLQIFRSRRRVELFLGSIAIVTLGFIILMIGIIQDYLANEFSDFDKIVIVLVNAMFKGRVDYLMNFCLKLGTDVFLISIIFYTLLWMLWKGKEKLLEIYFLVIIVAGGEFYEEVLRSIFHRLSPNEPSLLERFPSGFPSEQSLMAFVVYGFFFFVLLRHNRNIKIHTVLIISWITVLLFIGISRVYFGLQDPSQIAAGYVFGGVWLGLFILLLEIFRLLMGIDNSKKKSRPPKTILYEKEEN